MTFKFRNTCPLCPRPLSSAEVQAFVISIRCAKCTAGAKSNGSFRWRTFPRFPPSPVTLCLHLHYSADPPHPKKTPLSLCGGERSETISSWTFFTCPKITEIVLFARADWLARRWLAKYYSPPSSRRMTFVAIFLQTKLLFVIQLVWIIVKYSIIFKNCVRCGKLFTSRNR